MIGDEDNSTFRLNDNITRAETACIINRVLLPKQRQVVEKPVDLYPGNFAEPVETSSDPYHLLVAQNMTMTETKEDWDITFTVKGPDGEDSVKLSPDQKLDNSRWLLSFNIGQFSKDDDITISFSGDSSISCQDAAHEALTPYKVELVDNGSLGEGDVWVSNMQLEGTKDSPKVVWITKDFKNEAKVTLVKQDGSAVANEKITAISKSGLYRKEYTTDANGVIYINVDDFEISTDLYFTDRTYEFVRGTQEDGTVMSVAYGTVSPLHEGFSRTFTVVENAN